MKTRISLLAPLALALLLLAGCEEDDPTAGKPAPVEPTREAQGHYCGMILLDHRGPKAQIHLTGQAEPVWFSSVRDGIAFTMLPEEPKNIAAFYVNDMSIAQWDAPEPGTWIDAEGAWYVIGSARAGGMGAAEAVPFAERGAAERFTLNYGGRVVDLADVPQSYILSSTGPTDAHDGHAPDAGHGNGMRMDTREAVTPDM